MSKEKKLARADWHINENKKILKQIEKLKSAYIHHHESARNIFNKLNTNDWDRPEGYERYSYSTIFDDC